MEPGFQLVKSSNPPQGSLQTGFQNDRAGALWSAVAHTNWGDIPGKAKGGECWFSYGGKEHATNNFSYVVGRNFRLQKSNVPPPGSLQTGFQNDGAGALWSAVAHSNWGDIPGKAKGGECWFPYGGQEHSSNNFSYVVSSWDLIKGGFVPQGGVKGFQNDGAGDVWCVIAHTNWGDIPGKAKGNECWFPYGGKEHSTNNFSWVVCHGYRLERSGGSPPQNSLPCGFQNDGAGTLWVAIAHTNWGDIPGKAKDNTCWFSYGGQEHPTNNFSWVIV